MASSNGIQFHLNWGRECALINMHLVQIKLDLNDDEMNSKRKRQMEANGQHSTNLFGSFRSCALNVYHVFN